MNLSLFSKTVVHSLKYVVYFLGMLFVSRIIFLWVYAENNLLTNSFSDVLKAFVMGFRFDMSIVCYGFLPSALFWLASIFVKKRFSDKFSTIYIAFCKYYLTFVLFIFTAFQLIDFFFYQFFQSRINALFFGIFNDDTSAVLRSVWTDYPIFKIFLIFILVFVGFFWVHKKVRIGILSKKLYSKTLSLVLLTIFPLFFIGLRGSLGVFPLRREHTNVSANTFINSLCYNALYALEFARAELKESEIIPDIEQEIQKSGFNSFAEIEQIYKENVIDSIGSDFHCITPQNDFLEHNPPNVVFILMESMSNHYVELHSEKLNLLGDLATVLPDLYYFKNGLSAWNGTIATVENLLINSPKTIMSQSPYFKTSFDASVAKPFKMKGYDTKFITGAYPSWRNIDNLIKHQYFDTIKGSADIQTLFPEATSFAWGTHDGYLFDFIEQTLKNNTQKPQFIFSLTISNHSPYEIPSHYTPYPIEIPSEIKKKLRVDEKMAYENFYSYQYAASQLAKFIQNIKNSPLGENTIIVATGDHNVRQVFEYENDNMFLKYSVPILFYIPEKYKPTFFDDKILVSHKDIFPTLFNLSLSNQKYMYSGDNMFKESDKYRFAINSYNLIADNKGLLYLGDGTPLYYTWSDENNFRKLKTDNPQSEHARFMTEKLKTFSTLQTIKTYESINKQIKTN